MTVENQTKKVTAAGNDVATTFSFSPMVIFSSDQLEVTYVDSLGNETLLTEGTGASNYSVSVSSYPGTGSIVYPADLVTPLATGDSLVIKRVLTLEQLLDLNNQGGYFPDLQEYQFDKLVMIDLQQQEELDRSFRFPVSASGIDTETALPAALKYLRINAAEDGMEWVTLGSSANAAYDLTPENVDFAAGSQGASNDYARGDHVHFLPTVTLAKGGTGATDAATARTNLGMGSAAVINTGADAGEIAVNEQNWTAIASAATVNIGAAATERVNITGTTTITAFDTVTAGLAREVRFDGALTLTHNATSLILPGGANITTAAGDIAKFVSEGPGNWRCVKYMKASGMAIVAPTAAQGASMVLLGSYSPSAAASVDATSLITSTYRKYFVTFDLVPATDDVQLQMLTSTNNGVAFDSGASNYDYACRTIGSALASGDYTSAGATFIPLSRAIGGGQAVGNATNEGVSGNIWIHDPLNAATYTRVSMVSDGADSASKILHFEGSAQRLSAGDVDAFQLKFSSGNLTGEVRVYGIKDA